MSVPIAIVGGGLSGSLLAVFLARRGLTPVVLERDAPFDDTKPPQGRSINLALAARGIEALQAAGIYETIEPLMLPMKGRMLHDEDGTQRFAPYGQAEHEQIYSVSRADLHLALYRLAADTHGVEYRFTHECMDVDAHRGRLHIETALGPREIEAGVVLACDGGGSHMRRALGRHGLIEAREDLLDHGYKEFTIPPVDSEFALSAEALHIWPRGDFMLIALPNADRSFTATLFLPLEGQEGFAEVTPQTVGRLFARAFPDAAALIPALAHEYAAHPTGRLGTVRCTPWHAGRVMLIGDAAHAIVPFHGQGMNAAFEDCRILDRLIAQHDADWPEIFAAFEAQRMANADAMAEMALDNYTEMRDRVRDDSFQLKAELGFELERRFPGRWVRRYSMVMFRPDIEYAEARRRGEIQEQILSRLTRDAATLADIDFRLAETLLEQL